MTEQEVVEYKREIHLLASCSGFNEKLVALMLLAELVLALYKIAKEVNNIAKRIP